MLPTVSHPAIELRSYIDSYTRLTGCVSVPETITLLPDGGIHLVLNLGEPIRSLTTDAEIGHEGIYLVGTTLRPELQRLDGGVHLFVVRFHAGGFTHFFDGSLVSGLANRFEEFAKRDFPTIQDGLEDFPRALDRYFLSRLKSPRNPLRRVVNDIESHAGRMSLEALVRRHGYSERTLEREFRRQLGVTPKEFISLNRFRKALGRIQAPGAASLSDIAFDCGYCDQAHMAREFRRFAGTPPSSLGLSD